MRELKVSRALLALADALDAGTEPGLRTKGGGEESTAPANQSRKSTGRSGSTLTGNLPPRISQLAQG